MELSGDRLRRATRAAKAYRVGQTDVQSFKDYPIIARMGAAGYGTMSSPLVAPLLRHPRKKGAPSQASLA